LSVSTVVDITLTNWDVSLDVTSGQKFDFKIENKFLDYSDVESEEATEELMNKLKEAIANRIKAKQSNLVGNMASQGTTPRQLTDLIGSLCDLTSGSGDKGTPIIHIQGYFDNFTSN
jgi:hypothetical protein